MESLIRAVFLVICLSLAGVAHVLWLRSPVSRLLSQPVDQGVTLRGRRLFGANKMLRGFVAMPPATALAFGALGGLRPIYPPGIMDALWDLSALGYCALGLASGLAFMLAELPNSFLKRQLDVEPGGLATSTWLRPLCFVLDRFDSTLGVLLVVTLALPTSWATWGIALSLGVAGHALFSHWLHRVGVKARSL
jgi:hypothetical protein